MSARAGQNRQNEHYLLDLIAASNHLLRRQTLLLQIHVGDAGMRRSIPGWMATS